MIKLLGDSSYGGWFTETDSLNKNSIVYSFGIGDDISWDLEIIRNFGCKVYAFDPTPKSAEWLKKQALPEEFVFTAEGLSQHDGFQRFYDPYNSKNLDMSILKKNKTYSNLPVKRLKTFMKERGHNQIDVLKLDIEGSEFYVLSDITNIEIKQILVELHTRFFQGWKGMKRVFGWLKAKQFFYKLKRAGFKLVYFDEKNYNYTFLLSKN